MVTLFCAMSAAAAITVSNAVDPPISSLARQDLMGRWLVAAVPDDPSQANTNVLENAKWVETWGRFLLPRLPGMDPQKAEAVHYAWAKCFFEPPPESVWRNAVLHVHGVRWGAQIWLNGQMVGEHLGAYGAFEFDITRALKWGERNELLVRLTGWPVIPRSRAEDPTHPGTFPLVPHGAACFRWGNRHAGITGAIWIDYFDYARLEDVYIVADPSSGRVTVRGVMRNFTRQFGERWIEPTIIDPEGHELRCEKIRVPWANTGFRRTGFEFKSDLHVKNPRPWTPDSPVLYKLRLDLVQEGRLLHRWMENFGFRTFEARAVTPGEAACGAKGGFFLNGKRMYLRGICTVGEPHVFAEPEQREVLLRRTLVELPKAANLNCIRNHTVPLGPEVLDVLDRYGMLLLQEFPITMNYRNPLLTAEERAAYHEQCIREFRSLLPLYWNHPSVIIWVPTNESGFDTEWENGELYRLFRESDPGRPVMRAGEQSPDIFDTHCYDGFWNGPEGKFDLVVESALRRGRTTGKPVTITEYIENFRVGKWMGPKPENMSNEEWEAQRDDEYAQFILEQTETLRRLGYDGTLPYMWGRAYVRNLDRADEAARITPAFEALRSAQAPVLVSLALADRHFVAGGKLAVGLVACDDTESLSKVETGLLLVQGNPGFAWPSARDGVRIVWERKITVKVTAKQEPHSVTCPLPETPGRYYLLAVVEPGGQRQAVVSRRILDLVSPPPLEQMRGRRVAALGEARFLQTLKELFPSAEIQGGLSDTAGTTPHVVVVGPYIHEHHEELQAVAEKLRSYAEEGGRLVVLQQDRPIPLLGLDVPRVEGMGGASTAFRTGAPDFYGWRGLGEDSRLLRRFNGPTGAVVRHPVSPRAEDEVLAVAAQEGNDLNWPVVVRRRLGKGEMVSCQLTIADHLTGPHADPVAQTVLVNLLAP